MFKFAARFGLIGGAVAIVAAFLFFMLESNVSGLVNFVILLAVLVWGQLEYRKVGEPPISYGETLAVGVFIIFWFAMVSMLYTMVHWMFIDPEMSARALAVAEQAVRDQGLSEQEAQAALQIQRLVVGPIVTPIIGAISTMIFGTIIALITSIFTRTKA